MTSPIRLVIVGHLGFAQDATPRGSAVSLGGPAYACARGAAVVAAQGVGILARVGEDFNFPALGKLGVDLRGVNVLAGPSPRFSIRQYPDGYRAFESDLGVARDPAVDFFPKEYEAASHFHLATMPPVQQAEWLRFLRRRQPRSDVSVDMFEHNAAEHPDLCRALCRDADLDFLNKVECQLLFGEGPLPDVPMIIKGGAEGAWYRVQDSYHHIQAPQADAIDTTGAGEILAGVLLSLRTLGVEMTDALAYAVSVASAKVTEFGVDGAAVDAALAAVRDAIGERPGWLAVLGGHAEQAVLDLGAQACGQCRDVWSSLCQLVQPFPDTRVQGAEGDERCPCV